MDKCPKCGGNVKVLESSLQYWGGVHCIAVEENCHSVQQLKAEIAALATEIESCLGCIPSGDKVFSLIAKMRQLSAV
jgi:hypothetical protein